MKDLAEKIFLMGLGAMQLTSEKASILKEELIKKGEEAYKNGEALNEELKHNIKEKVKENVTVVTSKDLSKEDLAEMISKMDDSERKEILKMLKKDKNEK
ncbi:MAG: phasin family protein [Bacilli bacterium]|nr:phasin family protein [Bacilli bacterium]